MFKASYMTSTCQYACIASILMYFRSQSVSQLMKCRRVFQALINIAIEELCETADALIAPVRMGVARPTQHFSPVSPTSTDSGDILMVSPNTWSSLQG